VAEVILDQPQLNAMLDQVGGEAVPKRVDTFPEAETHAVCGKKKHPVSDLPHGVQKFFDLADGEDVGEIFYLRGFHTGNPVPVFFQGVFLEELESRKVAFDGAPGVALGERVEIRFHLVRGQGVRTAVKFF
jgi:hypothetical protein